MEFIMENLYQELECPICLDQLKNPKILSCLHSFCDKCLYEYYDDPFSIICLVCRESGMLADVKSDFIRGKFIEIVNKFEKNKSQNIESSERSQQDKLIEQLKKENMLFQTFKRSENNIEVHFDSLISYESEYDTDCQFSVRFIIKSDVSNEMASYLCALHDGQLENKK